MGEAWPGGSPEDPARSSSDAQVAPDCLCPVQCRGRPAAAPITEPGVGDNVSRGASNARLRTTVLGIDIENPVIVASGPLSDDPVTILEALEAGAGAVVTKTIYAGGDSRRVRPNGLPVRTGGVSARSPNVLAEGPKSNRDAVARPAPHRCLAGECAVNRTAAWNGVVRRPGGLLNNTTYSKRNVPEWLDLLADFSRQGLPVIASIHADDAERLAELAEQVCRSGCRALELGISCPNDGSHQRSNSSRVAAYTAAVRRRVTVPISVKLTADEGLLDYARTAVTSGADAISLSDTLPAIAVDIRQRRLAFSGPVGYSGPAIKPLVLNAIYRLRQAGLQCPIVGIGGIAGIEDVLEYLQIGACATQLLSQLLLSGIGFVSQLVAGLAQWCEAEQTTVESLVGAALEEAVVL